MPCTTKTDENAEIKIDRIIPNDCSLSIRMVAKMWNTDEETVTQTLKTDLNVIKVWTRMIP